MPKYLIVLTLSMINTCLVAQNKISGFVRDQAFGEPIQGVTVFLHNEYNLPIEPHIRVTTDEKGYYEFTNLEIKRYNVNFFNYYEVAGDTFALIIQPGIVTLTEELAKDEERNDFHLNVGMSLQYLIYLINRSQNPPKNDVELRESMRKSRFIDPRVFAVPEANYYRTFNHYFQKKNWE